LRFPETERYGSKKITFRSFSGLPAADLPDFQQTHIDPFSSKIIDFRSFSGLPAADLPDFQQTLIRIGKIRNRWFHLQILDSLNH